MLQHTNEPFWKMGGKKAKEWYKLFVLVVDVLRDMCAGQSRAFPYALCCAAGSGKA